MNAYAQAKHLFWKEYRTQRGLWMGLVGFCLIFHIVIRLAFPLPHQSGEFEFMVGAGYLTIFFYTLASTCLLYAAEREQGTNVLLRTMPVNRWLFYGVKVSWVGCSGLIAFLMFMGSAYLWTQNHTLSSAPESAWGYLFYAIPITLVLLCSLVATMMARNVLSAIGVSVVIIFLVVTVVPVIVVWLVPLNRGARYGSSDPVLSLLSISSWRSIICLFAISLELNRRWFRESDFSWRWGFRLTRAKTLAMALEDAPYTNSWRRLVWKECRSACIWFPVLAALSFGFVYLTHIGRGPYTSDMRVLRFLINMCLVPLLAGVASCRSDQSQERYRFLGNRGASSTQTLLTKHAVWMGGCAILLFLTYFFIWPFSVTISSEYKNEFVGSLYLIPVTTGLLSTDKVERLSGSLIPAVQFWACFSLLCYSLGHWFSMSLKQPVMSLMVAIISAIFGCATLIFYYALDVPLFILTVVPSAGLLALSFIWGEDWLTDRRERRDLAKPFWYGLLGLWTVITLLASWRVLGIPFSMTLDQTSLNNLSTRYMLFCLVGLLLVTAVLYVSDWMRLNFRTPAGKPVFVTRRDFRFGKILVLALFVHNVLGLVIVQGYQTFLKHEMNSSIELIQSDLHRALDRKDEPDLYTVANDAIPSVLPISAGYHIDYQPSDSTRHHLKWDRWSDVTTEQKQWLKENRKFLPMIWEADADGELLRMRVDLDLSGYEVSNPAGWTESVQFRPLSFTETHVKLINLVRLEALHLEHQGNLEEAWKHHIAVIRYARRFTDHNLPSARYAVLTWLNQVAWNGDLWRWQARREQVPELLAQASKELSDELSQLTSLQDSFQREAAGSSLFFDQLSSFDLIANVNLAAGMPWELQRFRALQHSRYQLASKLAGVIDRYQVPIESHPFSSDSELSYYVFDDGSYTKRIYLRADTYFLNSHSSSIDDRGLSQELRVGNKFDLVSVELPESVIETTLLAKYTPRQLATVFFDINLADMLRNELEFWRRYRSLQSSFAIYSYRAETGSFPAALYELKGTRTEELFDPILPSVAVNTLEVEPDQLHWIAGILKHDATLESYKDDYQWFHAGKWPQSEYNLGDTPDLKPPTPLIAPKTKEVP